jgi:hypothetical protein
VILCIFRLLTRRDGFDGFLAFRLRKFLAPAFDAVLVVLMRLAKMPALGASRVPDFINYIFQLFERVFTVQRYFETCHLYAPQNEKFIDEITVADFIDN